ncbi:MAG TPA: serine hydrolase, partial [Candidatus Sumerlaeota bacterium]|nr:serine hydrolase [Candidatus Sumerlaeota bacterium]
MAKKLCILRVILIIFSGLLLDGCTTISSKPVGIEPLKTGTLQEAGFDPGIFKSVDTILQEAIVKNVTPGAVLLVGKDNMIVYEKAYGNRRLRPHIEPMTADTIFDLASCSKVLGTSTMAMLLIQDGKLQLDTKVADVLPQFAQNEKGNVTVWNLLTHTSGLPAYCDWKEAEKLRGNKTPDDALIDYIASLKKKYPTGEYYIYSCLNFLTLARVNETIAGESMHSFLKRRVWDLLNMTSSGYLLTPEQKLRTATTTSTDSLDDIGIVHDPLARYHKATDKHCPGNAGLFMSSGDMAVMAQLILNKGIYNGIRIFKPETVDLWTQPQIHLPAYDAKK